MQRHTSTEHTIPSSPRSFRLSRLLLAFMAATILLALLIGLSTYRNISRARDLMEQFLLSKGETVIRSIEAGSRTTTLHHTGGGNPLHTLITESIRASGIAFIRIVNRDNRILDQTEPAPAAALSPRTIERIVATGLPVTEMNHDLGIFTVSTLFHPGKHFANAPLVDGHRLPWEKTPGDAGGTIISVGLMAAEFDAARRQDIQHAVLMGGILFLVGSAGIYFLFLYQQMRVAKSTLADMKLYTDNVIESIPAGLITLDARQRVVSCNRKAEEILQRSSEDIHGRRIGEALPGCPLDWAEICGSDLGRAAEWVTDDGRQVPIQINGSALINEEGEAIGTVLIVRDMTAIREMEHQLERSRRMAALGRMAAGIAHEIRNPLGTLRGFAHYFGSQAGASAESKGYAELMVSEVDRLNRNISGLLQFARPREPQFVPVQLDGLIAKTVALMEGDFANHGLNFHWQCNTGIELEADPDLLLQVLMNLLQNSIHATPAGGEVSLTAAEEDRQVRIAVADTGCGMNEQEREKMFDPFFTTRKTGTGLGLAVSHRIVEQHQGVFEVDTAPGRGTTVILVVAKKRGGGS